MIREAIDRILDIATKTRPPLLELSDGSERRFLYDDTDEAYKEIPRYVVRRRQVSTLQSFADMVNTEIDRNRKVNGAVWPTVIFTTEGGAFHLDDADGRTTFGFKRVLAPGYLRVLAAIGQPMEHLAFLRLLQGIREFIVDPSVLAAYRKVVFDNSVRVDSQPLLEGGRVGNGYHVELTAKAGAVEVNLPDIITLALPYSRGGEPYTVELAVDISLVTKGEKAIPYFSLAWPEHLSFVERAVNDEIAKFRELTSHNTDFVVLENL